MLLFQKFDPILNFFAEWEQEVYSVAERSPTTELPPFQTMADLKTTIRGLCDLLRKAKSLGMGLQPHRINQDVVEAWFGHHRQACGANRNMTGEIFKKFSDCELTL